MYADMEVDLVKENLQNEFTAALRCRTCEAVGNAILNILSSEVVTGATYGSSGYSDMYSLAHFLEQQDELCDSVMKRLIESKSRALLADWEYGARQQKYIELDHAREQSWYRSGVEERDDE